MADMMDCGVRLQYCGGINSDGVMFEYRNERIKGRKRNESQVEASCEVGTTWQESDLLPNAKRKPRELFIPPRPRDQVD